MTNDAARPSPPPSRRGGSRSRVLVLSGVAAVAVLLAASWAVWAWGQRQVDTDDAFVEADVVTVAAEVSGSVSRIYTPDNARVARGVRLLDLDAENLSLERDAARASQDVAVAQKDETGAAGASASGPAQAARRRAADASLRLAKAKVAEAELALGKTHLSMPVDGYVARRMVSQGDLVRVGQPLFAVVSARSWVTANLKETQLAKVKPGDAATVTIDAFPDLRLAAHVDSIQYGAGQVFSVLPSENASGNFVRVVQRVPVKLVFDGPPPRALPPGLSAHVSIRVR
jgi:membrane fusion protein (multidrug efflux system)